MNTLGVATAAETPGRSDPTIAASTAARPHAMYRSAFSNHLFGRVDPFKPRRVVAVTELLLLSVIFDQGIGDG
jgi:hypothetical protein